MERPTAEQDKYGIRRGAWGRFLRDSKKLGFRRGWSEIATPCLIKKIPNSEYRMELHIATDRRDHRYRKLRLWLFGIGIAHVVTPNVEEISDLIGMGFLCEYENTKTGKIKERRI